MNRTKIICLANSSKHKERCIAGIDLDLVRWIRPVSPDYPEDGRVPWKTLIHQGNKILNLADIKPLDILEIPLDETGPDFGFECENLTIAPGEWHLLGQANIDKILPFVNFNLPILHSNQKYVAVPSLQALPFDKRRSLELVYTDSLTITQQSRIGGGTKWKGSFATRGGYCFNEITITDTESFDLLAMGIYPNKPCLLVMSLGMPYTPPGWNGPVNPCWKLISC